MDDVPKPLITAMRNQPLARLNSLLAEPNRVARIAHYIRQRYRQRKIAHATAPLWVELDGRYWIQLDPQSLSERWAYIEGAWEPHLSALIKHVVRSGDTCIDIGAHKGYVTCLMASLVGAKGRVLAFEPDPRADRMLRDNIGRNGFDNVRLFDYALGNGDGPIEIFLTRTLGNTSQFPNPSARAELQGRLTVRCARFDSDQDAAAELVRHPLLTFVKMDAEGAEPLIWRGMARTMARCRPIVSMEMNYRSLQAAGTDLAEFAEFLRGCGYATWYESRRKPATPATYGISLTPIDIGVPRSQIVDAIGVSSASPYRDRIADLVA